jgi:glycosyltransferase involved in cell wall biosynthesis
LNVLFVIPTLGHGGAQKVVVELCNDIVRESAIGAAKSDGTMGQISQLHLLTFADEAAVPSFYHPPEEVMVSSVSAYSNKKPHPIRFLLIPAQIRKFIKKHEIDVVISFMDIANFMVLVGSVRSRARTIVSERQDTRYYKFPELRRLLRFFLYRSADKVVVQTDIVHRQMPKSADVVVIPNACPEYESEALQGAPVNNVYKAITVGRLEKQKNIGFLIKASSRMFKNRDDWILEIYGTGSMRDELQSLIEQYSLSKHVFLRGACVDIESRLCDSHLFLFPSLYEGFPNALAEAISAGLPVVGFSDVSGVCELIEHDKNGFLIARNGGDVRGFADAAASLMDSNSLRAEMGRHSRKISSRFRRQCVFKKWWQVISS